ncbi:MAG: tetratricopeptide repeat protein [Bdellovibrionota bacterium]|jgi:Tfp pilus assembly protein PilF
MIIRFLAVLFIFFLFPLSVVAETVHSVATLYSGEGTVQVLRSGETTWKDVNSEEEFNIGDAIRVGKHGRAAVKFADGTLVRISKNATVIFEGVKAENVKMVLNMKNGLLHLFSRENREHPQVKTPVMTAAIHGTEFVIEAAEDLTTTTVIAGAVEGSNEWGNVLARGSEQITAKVGEAPRKALVVDPYQSAQWTFYYPALLDLADYADFESGASNEEKEAWRDLKAGDNRRALNLRGEAWRSRMARSVAALQNKDTDTAFAEVEIDRADDGASYLLYKSSLHLSFGEVQEAEKNMDLALQRIPYSAKNLQPALKSALYAQRAVLALTNNKIEEAKNIVELGEREDPATSAILLAKSYVKQGEFDLEKAREAAEELLSETPHCVEANLRLAELELGFDNRNKAEDYVKAALQRDPKNAQAYAIAGFIALQKNEVDRAMESFQKALKIEAALPLAQLGSGLALIHQGDLERGRAAIEKAVHLSPNVSLYRSYLGKAFFEDGKEDLAEDEFNRAIELDPDDPTPYLYRAFNNLSTNRVVEALKDVETSIAKNDNRAIFRSELLLDRDEATRTANLAEIFNELGFSQAARVEAIKAINTDYTNYSAHRLLANSYDSILLSKSAFSEDRISTLLSPLSFNVFNNTAAESSLNEYTSLFDKNEHRTGLNLTGMTYSDTLSGELFQTGRVDDLGYLIKGGSSAEHGSKDGNYLRDDRLRVALQHQINPDNRVLLDGSYSHISERSNATEVFPTTNSYDGGDVTFGYHGRLDSNSHLLAQVSYFKDNDRFHDLDLRDVLVGFSSSLDRAVLLDDEMLLDMRYHDEIDQAQAGLQHVFDSKYLSTIVGYEYIYTDVNRSEDSSILYDEPLNVFTNLAEKYRSEGDYGMHSNNVYAYTIAHLDKWADITFGFGYTALDFEKTTVPTYLNDTYSTNKPNWKAGLTLYPTSELTLRSAYFKGVASSAVENLRTLEPTLVGGINQFYSDLPGTEAENIGVGVDYKIPGSTYLGGEYVHRNLDTDFAIGTSMYDFDFDGGSRVRDILIEDFRELRDQDLASAYFYQVLSKQLTGTLDYMYSREHLNVDFSQELQRHTAALGLKYFATNNIFTYARGVWRQQDRMGSFYFDDGTSDFWTVDLGIGYRIPDRHGLIKLELLNLADKKFDLDQSLGFYEFIPEGIGGRIVASFNF